MFQQVWDLYGRIDALCANAGIVDRRCVDLQYSEKTLTRIVPFSYLSIETQTSKLACCQKVNLLTIGRIPPKPDLLCTDVDYKGVVYGTQLAIHFMRKNKVPGGKIVATASAAAIVPHETYPEYDGAKAAVVNFVRATARVLKDVSRVNVRPANEGADRTQEGEHYHQHSVSR